MVCFRCKDKEETERREGVKEKTQVEKRTKRYFVSFYFLLVILPGFFRFYLFDTHIKDSKLIWIPEHSDLCTCES